MEGLEPGLQFEQRPGQVSGPETKLGAERRSQLQQQLWYVLPSARQDWQEGGNPAVAPAWQAPGPAAPQDSAGSRLWVRSQV